MRKWLPYIVLVVLFLFLFSNGAEAQCSQCKLLAQQSGSHLEDSILDNTNGNNINSAILYIMSIPYILVGIIAFIFRKNIKAFFNRPSAK